MRFLLDRLWWSSEEISNCILLETGKSKVSTSTIYRALGQGLLRDTLGFYLRLQYKSMGRSKKPGNKLKKCFARSISERLAEAAARSELGYWEGDTMLGANQYRLVTLVNRKSRYLLLGVSPSAQALDTNEMIAQLLQNVPVHTVTFDQGMEFSRAIDLEDLLHAKIYFSHPHFPWERPTNENTNGLLHQFIPRRSNISSLASSEISSFSALLHFRSRKCLGWLSPYEVFFHLLLHFT